MTTFREIQDEVLQILNGYGIDQPRSTYLTAAALAADLSFSVASAADFDQGLAEIEGELVFVESVDRTNGLLNFAPDGRGYFGTTAADHAENARIVFSPVWTRHRAKAAINDTIVGTHPVLFGVGTTQFTFNPSVTTYEIPAEAERVLSVQADVNGPSKEQQRVGRYAFNSVAPTDDWPTGNTVTFHEAVTPGRTVTVTYTKRPSALALDGDQLTTSGLGETAKRAVVFGACSQLLSYADISRLHVDTARADAYDEKVQVGMATRLAGQLELRFQQELESERRRLRQATPVPVTTRRR